MKMSSAISSLIAVIYLSAVVGSAADRHGGLALVLLIAGWLFCAWRVVVLLRARREREAQPWERVDLSAHAPHIQNKGR
ncbi:MAG: hypothetical protein JO218_03525 [Burkholderiales bacterium]|nr:hypothetical protein [Burkholderiales bacterium]